MCPRICTRQQAARFDRQGAVLDAYKASYSGLIFTLFLLILAAAAQGQTATTTVALGGSPRAVAVNPATNKIYVVNGINVTVIDGATTFTNTVTDPNAELPFAVAVNPATNKIY